MSGGPGIWAREDGPAFNGHSSPGQARHILIACVWFLWPCMIACFLADPWPYQALSSVWATYTYHRSRTDRWPGLGQPYVTRADLEPSANTPMWPRVYDSRAMGYRACWGSVSLYYLAGNLPGRVLWQFMEGLFIFMLLLFLLLQVLVLLAATTATTSTAAATAAASAATAAVSSSSSSS